LTAENIEITVNMQIVDMVRVFPCTLAAARTNSSEWMWKSPASPADFPGNRLSEVNQF
jgi:hypothetical protein